jgi:FKBP-type peptidyl-prolyl cis-trans isomerase SlyD
MSQQVISFKCVVMNRLGQVLSSTFNRDVINQRHLNQDRLPDLVDGLQSVSPGEHRRIFVPAHRAYGLFDPKLTLEIPRAELAYRGNLTVGSVVSFSEKPGLSYRVVHLNSCTVVLDGNHPFAGQDLIFEVEIVSARDAQASDFLKGSGDAEEVLLH